MLGFYREVARHLAAGETLALATVVRTKGSAPREPGARMALAAGGTIIGTVGGGYAEAEATRVSLEVIRTGEPRLLHVEMMEDAASRIGATCGGTMDIFVELIR